MFQKLHKRLSFLYWVMYRSLFASTDNYRFDGLKITINKNVFHPGFFYSTKNMYNFIQEINMKDAKVLELGAGSGLLALGCAKRGAKVLASDINPHAIDLIKKNANKNKLNIDIIESDLFDSIPKQTFNYILINPPYYKGDPTDDFHVAFYAGANFQYFKKLFKQLREFKNESTKVYMILADNCNIQEIQDIAKLAGFDFELKKTIKHMFEENYIFCITN